MDAAANDFHLKSVGGHFNAADMTWVKDDVTSPCVDTGGPMTMIGGETTKNRGPVDMGVYGGTAQASHSP